MSDTLSSFLLPPQAQPVLNTPAYITLRVFLLERVVPVQGGEYTVADTTFRARFLCGAVLAVQVALWTFRWRQDGKLLYIMSITDILVSIGVTTHCIVAVMTAAREPPSSIVAYHTAIVRLDEILWMERTRASDVTRFNRVFSFFFAPMIVHMVVMTVIWGVAYGWFEVLIHLGDVFCRIISDLSALNNAGRLIEVENRTAALVQWLRQLASSRSSPRPQSVRLQEPSHSLSCPPQWQMARECYVLLCEMCANIDSIYAFQVVLCFVRGFIVMTVSVQEFVVTLTEPEELQGSQGYFTEDMPGYIFMAPITLYILDACLVVLITVLQIQQAANLKRLRRDILLYCEILAVHKLQFNVLEYVSMDRLDLPDRTHPVTNYSMVDSSSQERPHMHYGSRVPCSDWKGGTWSSLVDLCHRRPIQFTARGFFSVDYTLLATMFSAITTYTIILLNQSIQRLQSTDTPPPME